MIQARHNKTYIEAINNCTEEIAQVLEAHFDLEIEDVSRINDLIEQEIKLGYKQQAKQNELDNINGGSR
jgi:hypothetical protein